MDILNDIKECFSTMQLQTVRKLNSLGNEYKAYAVKTNDSYGVAIEYDREEEIYETFANAEIQSMIFTYIEEGKEKSSKFLYLCSSNIMLRNEFAIICKHFVDPGEDGILRMNLLNSPYEWWESWKSLLGNSEKNYSSYSVLAELLVYKKLYNEDKEIEWSSIYNGTHDFESKDYSCEVKSTIKKYDLSISINSQNQLHSKKPVFLYFCRLEKSNLGICINDVVNDLISLGISTYDIEEKLSSIGLKRGKIARSERFIVRDRRVYKVDEYFPKLFIDDVADPKVRDKLLKIVYTIDLSGLKYEVW